MMIPLLLAAAISAVDACNGAALDGSRDGSEIVIRAVLVIDRHSIHLAPLPPASRELRCLMFVVVPGLPSEMIPGDSVLPRGDEAQRLGKFLSEYRAALKKDGGKPRIVQVRGVLRVAPGFRRDASNYKGNGFGYRGLLRTAIIAKEIGEVQGL